MTGRGATCRARGSEAAYGRCWLAAALGRTMPREPLQARRSSSPRGTGGRCGVAEDVGDRPPREGRCTGAAPAKRRAVSGLAPSADADVNWSDPLPPSFFSQLGTNKLATFLLGLAPHSPPPRIVAGPPLPPFSHQSPPLRLGEVSKLRAVVIVSALCGGSCEGVSNGCGSACFSHRGDRRRGCSIPI